MGPAGHLGRRDENGHDPLLFLVFVRRLSTHESPNATLRETFRVLVIDDDAAVGRAIARTLTASGHSVSVAMSGLEAIAVLGGEAFDCVVSDIQMPNFTGMELLEFLRDRGLDVPVVLVTGDPSIDTALRAIDLGAAHYLVKPIEPGRLERAVERAVHGRTSGRYASPSTPPSRPSIPTPRRSSQGVEAPSPDSMSLRTSFVRALNSAHIAFQPIVRGNDSELFGYEALLRTREASLPHPAAVIDAAERLGALSELGSRVRSLAARGFTQAPEGSILFINLHTLDLLEPALYDPSHSLTQMAERVVLEITERAAVTDIDDLPGRISRLRALGFRIAVDDLGAGYAGLSTFALLEPEFVKLDMSLVRDIHISQVRQRVVVSMINLCKDLGHRVIAEGVETKEECECLRALGVDLLQGYFFARPGPPFPDVAR